jgi:uncharacterized membrane protein YeaQ/YmgE (transglycosylase-associated protein family)
MGVIAWILLGALAGWIVSMLMGSNEEQGWLMNIALGIAGALVGGAIWNLLAEDNWDWGFNVGSLIVAILGGLILSYALRFFQTRSPA